MKMESKLANIAMVPGDALKINVGIQYKCDIVILHTGKLRVYYEDGKCLEI